MKIALYYPWIHLKSGIERTILETIKNSRHDWTIFTNHYDKNQTFPDFKKLPIRELNRVPIDRRLRKVIRASLAIATQKLPIEGFDALVIHSDGIADLAMIRMPKIPVICFCHTPLRPIFDPIYQMHVFSKLPTFKKYFYLLFGKAYKKIDQLIWEKYAHIIFNSLETKNRAKSGGLIPTNSTNFSIIHPGVTLPPNDNTINYQPFILLPGRIMWTKNIELAVKVVNLATENQQIPPNWKLIIAGQVDHKSRQYFNSLKKLAKHNSSVEFVINPTDQQLETLYQNCSFSLMTSFNEDWGITVLEANAHRKPVIAVKQGGPIESIIHQKTGLLVPNDVKLFSQEIIDLIQNPKLIKHMGQKAYLKAQDYAWIKQISQLDHLLDKVVSHE